MRKHPAIISFVYIVLGTVWLVLGNSVIEYLDKGTPNQDLSFLYGYKNIIFLFVSGFVLFLLIEMYRRNLSGVEKKYETLFEGSPAAIYVFEKESFRFLEVNEVMIRKYGYSRKELLGMTALDIRPAEEREKLITYFSHEPEEGHETGIWLHRKKDGSLFHMLISYHSTVYNGLPAYTVIAIDVEDHVKAEEKIKELLNTYETVTNITNDVIWEYCPYSDHLEWMEGFADIYGYTEELRESTKDWIFSKTHPDDREKLEQSLEEAFAQRSNTWRCEYRFLCADGTYKHVSNQAFILLGPNGKPLKMVGALRDITVGKNYEHRLLLKNEMLKKIAWNNSHGLRRPVGNIIGIINLLKADAETAQTDEKMLEMLEKSALELDDIVTKINVFTSKIDLQN